MKRHKAPGLSVLVAGMIQATRDTGTQWTMHQGSALSPLLFVIVMEALSREFRVTLPWELLYVDGLVVIAETKDGARPRGRPKKTWREIVEKDCQAHKLNKKDAVDRERRRKQIRDDR